jgi:hypothetical protein
MVDSMSLRETGEHVRKCGKVFTVFGGAGATEIVEIIAEQDVRVFELNANVSFGFIRHPVEFGPGDTAGFAVRFAVNAVGALLKARKTVIVTNVRLFCDAGGEDQATAKPLTTKTKDERTRFSGFPNPGLTDCQTENAAVNAWRTAVVSGQFVYVDGGWVLHD